MSNEVLEKQAVSMADVKDELAKIEKRDGELSFRATRTKEYLQAIKLPSKKASSDMAKAITALEIPRLKDVHVFKLIDLMPKSEAEAKVILQGYALTVSNDNISKIISVIKEHAPKK